MKKVLIISPYFAPENTIASVRCTKLAKYLKASGYHVTVICSDNMAVSKHDRILEQDARDLDHIYRIPPIGLNQWIKKIYSKIEAKNKKNQKKTSQTAQKNKAQSQGGLFHALVSSKAYDRFFKCWVFVMELLQGRVFVRFARFHEKELGGFDCVISSYGPVSAHMLARYLKRNKLCKFWIADFRDVVYDSVDKRSLVASMRKKMLAKMCVSADAVTAITADMLRSLEEYTRKYYRSSIRKKASAISNGFDEEDRSYLEREAGFGEQVLKFVYCGTIYYNKDHALRNPRPLFQALQELASEGKIDLDKIQIRYAGGNFDVFVKYAAEYGMEDRVLDCGFVERIQSLNLQRNSDVILSLSWNTKRDKSIMTGKIYEAFIAEQNVLCLVSGDEPDSALGKMIRKTGIGYVWEEGNQDTIGMLKDWVMKIYCEKMTAGEVEYSSNKKEIEKYSYRYLAQKFMDIMEQDKQA